jgi:hypothetical protein
MLASVRIRTLNGMSRKKKKDQPQQETPTLPAWWKQPATWISIVSLVATFWFNYVVSLPALSSTIELLQPLRPSEAVRFQVVVKNDGKTTARHMDTDLRFSLQKADIPFEATYDQPPPPGMSADKPSADLNAGAQITMINESTFNLTHDHDINAVMSGTHKLYIYGRIAYRDILGLSHQHHFCRFYRPIPGDPTPLRLYQCTEYNETL